MRASVLQESDMSLRSKAMRPGTLRLHRATIIDKRTVKGRRAKRGRRTEYKTVFLQCGIIDARELEAVEGLKSLRLSDATEGDLPRKAPRALPSKFTGLRENTERLVAHVAAASDATVQFWIPQVAYVLGVPDATVGFIVDILVAFTVVTPRQDGSFIWSGREALWKRIRSDPSLDIFGEWNEMESKRNDLADFCSSLLCVLWDAQEPVCLADVREEMIKRRDNGDLTSMWHQLHCVNAVLVAAGIVRGIQSGSERRYMLVKGIRQKDIKPEPSLSSMPAYEWVKTKESVTDTRPPATMQYIRDRPSLQSVPVIVDKRMSTLKMVLDSVGHNVVSVDSSMAKTQYVPFQEGQLPTTRAAVMEIVGSDVNQVGIVDILGKAALPCHMNQGSAGSSPVIALAVPQWMLMQRSTQQPLPPSSLPAQIFALDASTLNTRALSTQTEPMYYVPVLQGSSVNTLGNVVAARGNIYPPPNKPDGTNQRSFPISRLKHV